jgi:hypothetical protein
MEHSRHIRLYNEDQANKMLQDVQMTAKRKLYCSTRLISECLERAATAFSPISGFQSKTNMHNAEESICYARGSNIVDG